MADIPTNTPSVGASIGSGLGNIAATAANYYAQKSLMRQQNELMWDNFKRAGATPAAIAAGVTGNASSPSAPTVSTGGNPFPDLGQTAIGAQNANTQQAVGQSNIDVNTMRLMFEPQKYYADCSKALAEAYSSTKQAMMYGSMKQNYDELNKDLRLLRPWKIASAYQTLVNDMQQYNNLVSEENKNKSETARNYAQAEDYRTHADVNRHTLPVLDAQKDLYEDQSKFYRQSAYNLHLSSFRTKWENDLLSQGIDVNQPFWENCKRLMYTDPQRFKTHMDVFIKSLNILDNKLQENLGEHYKRNIALAGLAYGYNNIHQKNSNNRAYRLGIIARSISSFIPFAGGSMPLSPELSSPSYFDYHSMF